MKKITILVCCIIFFAVHTYGQEISSKTKLLVEKQVDSVFHQMVKASESLDYARLAQGVDDSKHAGFIVNGTYFTTFDSLLNFVKTRAQGVVSQQLSFQNIKVTALSPQIALVNANGTASVELNSGNTFSTDFFWSFVYEKVNGQWKAIQSHQSSKR